MAGVIKYGPQRRLADLRRNPAQFLGDPEPPVGSVLWVTFEEFTEGQSLATATTVQTGGAIVKAGASTAIAKAVHAHSSSMGMEFTGDTTNVSLVRQTADVATAWMAG